MKCIHCGNDTNFKVRLSNGGSCRFCSHKFAFEPKTDPMRLTDGLFAQIIKDVSAAGTIYYTEKQLWYEFNRRTAKKHVSCGASMILLALVLPAARALSSHHLALACVFAAPMVLAATSTGPRRRPAGPTYTAISLLQFRSDYLHKWIRIHGDPDHLLPELQRPEAGGSFTSGEDLTAFSFDRALITEQADTAAMLIANNFHFENNCAILSLDGYPWDRFDTVFKMLGQNPQLMVYALHDASYEGAQMGAELRAARWFPDPSIRIVDLGLRPATAQKANMIMLKAPPGPQPGLRASLSADELAWLAQGNTAELANVRPARLIRAIFQGFARSSQMGDDAASVYDSTGMMIWMYDPGMDIYAADSFG